MEILIWITSHQNRYQVFFDIFRLIVVISLSLRLSKIYMHRFIACWDFAPMWSYPDSLIYPKICEQSPNSRLITYPVYWLRWYCQNVLTDRDTWLRHAYRHLPHERWFPEPRVRTWCQIVCRYARAWRWYHLLRYDEIHIPDSERRSSQVLCADQSSQG